MTLTSAPADKKLYDIKSIRAQADRLMDIFDRAREPGAFHKIYQEQVNTSPLLQPDNFNRSAHIPLMTYFLARAMGKSEEEQIYYKAAFMYEAKQPSRRKNLETGEPYEVQMTCSDKELMKIIKHTDTVVDALPEPKKGAPMPQVA